MASGETRDIIISIVGVGVALGALVIQRTNRGDSLRKGAIARPDSTVSRALAEAASDRRVPRTAMDRFRREMQRLAERPALSSITTPTE